MTRLTYKKIDWTHYLSRPKEFFQIFILVKDFKGSELRKAIGCGYDHWLFTNDGGRTVDYWYSGAESDQVFEHVRQLFNKKKKLKTLFRQAHIILEEFVGYIDNFKDYKLKLSNIKDFQALYKQAISRFVEYFSYAVELPYIFGSALEKYNLNRNSDFAWLLRECEKFRAVSLYPKYQGQVLNRLLDALAKFLGTSRDVLSLITPEEVLGYCKDQLSKQALIKLSAERQSGFLLFANHGKLKFLDNFGFLKSLRRQTNGKIFMLKGMVAQRGWVKGFVKVIFTKKEFNKMKSGDILVTIQSNPSLMPVIKKAAAIVADEGGIMSHAAIISRELKKPCIIGTKIATKVLRDGDLVEVDAERGVVRILKRK